MLSLSFSVVLLLIQDIKDFHPIFGLCRSAFLERKTILDHLVSSAAHSWPVGSYECVPRTIWDARAEEKGNKSLVHWWYDPKHTWEIIVFDQNYNTYLEIEDDLKNCFGKIMSFLRNWKSFFFLPPPLQSPLRLLGKEGTKRIPLPLGLQAHAT